MGLLRAAAVLAVLLPAAAAPAQGLDQERARGARTLREVEGILRKHYHDPARLSGLPARIARAQEEMERAGSEAAVTEAVASVLMDLEDPHTFFIPPPPEATFDHGWTAQVIGESCYVTSVRSGSDAERQGLRPGDRLLAIEGIPPDRATLWRIRYLVDVLRPRPRLRVAVEGAQGPRELTLAAAAAPARRFAHAGDYLAQVLDRYRSRPPSRLRQVEGGVLLWRLSSFDVGAEAIEEGVARARRARGVVLDLRDNGGGAVEVLRRLAGAFFAEPVSLGRTRDRRGERRIVSRRPARATPFQGPLVVVVDADSASAAEVFARTVQLQRRGLVVGDRTAGLAMVSRLHGRRDRRGTRELAYAVSVTSADFLLPDGSRLEGRGVEPDERVLPTPEDLRAGRDPALARAAALAGGRLSPAEAARLFRGEEPPS